MQRVSELSEYDYDLPKDLIAQVPLRQRADARLMLVDRHRQEIEHRHVRDLPEILRAGDCLVVNNTKVVPARLLGHRSETSGRWEGLFLEADQRGNWRLLCKTRGKLGPGEAITLDERDGNATLELRLVMKEPGGVWVARPQSDESTWTLLDRFGHVPLPCYIRRGASNPADCQRYQTVYAQVPGSAAAPTAGLHFTPELLERLEHEGVTRANVTLHVGLDTFRPIAVESLAEHEMHSEFGTIDEATVAQLATCRAAGHRIVAVGTTSVRVLETAAAEGALTAWSGHTRLFIRPPYEFRGVDALLTNFHLPRSTLLVLVRTFGGDALIRRAYDEAIEQQYRFYSYGDAMLII
ncbi:MAG: tRNA preQ1(34) S-adenosylmethionine ribosyltransferase-isomerase QueA [Planctomycetales bacterium]|nr:tRNA preQ1(34) S-adenosylmethionine ribosyltransferase-isomerase QueA [Planctomycetales bacterium]